MHVETTSTFPTDFRKLSTSLRLEIYNRALSLKKHGMNIRQIEHEIFKNYGMRFGGKTVYFWTTGRSKACNQLRIFVPKVSKELGYLIGVFLGDGCITRHKNNYQYRFSLKVKDKDFAENVASILSKLLNFNYKIAVHNDYTRGNRKRFGVTVGSKMLFEFLSQSLENPLICTERYPGDFIKGLFDSDGFTIVSVGRNMTLGFGIANTDLKLLKYVKFLLDNHFDIKSRIYASGINKGSFVKIWGKTYVANENVFTLRSTGLNNTRKFYNSISSSIYRKSDKLKDAICILENIENDNRTIEWKKIYRKEGREWVKK